MPAKSKAQQQMFAIARSIQKGDRKASTATGPATDVAANAKPKDVKDFASTKTKNLPQKVKKEQVERIREYVTKVVKEVLAEANSGKSDEPSISQGKDGDWWVSGSGGYQDGPFKTQGKAWGAMVYYKKRGITSSRSDHSMSEAYNRGTALISINGRNGHVRWRTSDGQYDEDLPGQRSKEHVQRRVAQIKKKLWGYTIKINDPDGMLKEASGTKSFSVGQVVYYNGEDGTVVSVSSKSGRIVKVAFDHDHVSFARSNKDGKYRAQGSSLNSTPLSEVDGMLKEAKFEFEWYEQGRWLTKIITGTEHDANVMLDKIRDQVNAAGEATGNVSYTKIG